MSDSTVHPFFLSESGVRILYSRRYSGCGAKQTEQKKKQNKTKKRGNKLLSYFTIVLSSYDADLCFDQNTDQRLFFLQVTVADNTN